MSQLDSTNRLKKILYTFGSLNDLGGVITSHGSVDEMTKSGLYLMLGTLSSSRGAIFHYSLASSRMQLLARKSIETDGDLSFPLRTEDEQSLLNAPRVVDIRSTNHALGSFCTLHQRVFRNLQASFLSPLRVRGELVGLLVIGECFGGEEYSVEDLQILAMMSRQLSAGLHNQKLFSRLQKKVDENRSLYENLRQIYSETIQAFATAIDAKDEYTKGHSARVSQYAVAIGEEWGLSGDELEGLRLAGLLHDIGKITVDSSIIRKDTRLESHEVKEMHRHPSIGYEILANINFPWVDLSRLARHHHEMVDGNGYPDGLRGDDLPPGVRIISVSDSFDAMTSDRPYRKQIGLENTLREIQRCTGTQFDPEATRALFQVLMKELSGKNPEPRILPCLNMGYDPVHLLQVLAELSGTLAASAEAGCFPGAKGCRP